jgi:CheY-like chemotaxis protein
MHVLCVDDDRINLMLFEGACAAVPGLRVSTAANGAEAIELARADPPHLLVIDLHLPDTDGHALLHALRLVPALCNVPAYLCSADDGPELRQAASKAGFAGCWSKPVDVPTLRRDIAALDLARAG